MTRHGLETGRDTLTKMGDVRMSDENSIYSLEVLVQSSDKRQTECVIPPTIQQQLALIHLQQVADTRLLIPDTTTDDL